MKTTEYYMRFWTARHELEELGVKQPLNELIKLRLIRPSSKNTNISLGRQQDFEFLKSLEMMVKIYEFASSILNDLPTKEEQLEYAQSWIKHNNTESKFANALILLIEFQPELTPEQ